MGIVHTDFMLGIAPFVISVRFACDWIWVVATLKLLLVFVFFSFEKIFSV